MWTRLARAVHHAGALGLGEILAERTPGRPLAAVRIRSDVERKRMAGIDSDDVAGDFGQGLYEPEMKRRTYTRLLECAESCLEGGMNTIVDAAFLSRSDRRSFQELAVREGAPFIVLACQADHATMVRRLEERRQRHTDPSDADVEILKSQFADPLNDGERPSTLVIDTTHPKARENTLAAIRSRLKIDAA